MFNSMSGELLGARNANMSRRFDLQESMVEYQKSNEQLIAAIGAELTGHQIEIEHGSVDYGTAGWSADESLYSVWHSWYRNPRHPRNIGHESRMLQLSGITTVLGAVALKVPYRNSEHDNGIEVVHLVVDGTTGVTDESFMTEETFSARQQIATRFDTLEFSLVDERLATSL